MSKQYFKTYITFKDWFGECCTTFFIQEDNSTDYRIIVDENGNPPDLMGEDSYFDVFGDLVKLKETNLTKQYKSEIHEISWNDLPPNVQQAFKPYNVKPDETKRT